MVVNMDVESHPVPSSIPHTKCSIPNHATSLEVFFFMLPLIFEKKMCKIQIRKTDEICKYLRSTASHRPVFYVYVHAHVYVSNLRNLPIY